jgi:starch phosphorylase
MEFGLEPGMPTYSGGLGVLAGDTVRAAADLGIPMVGITLLHRKGYFRQRLDESGNQTEEAWEWDPEDYLQPLEPGVTIRIAGRQVRIRAWRYIVRGIYDHTLPVYFLDTAHPDNDEWDQGLTDYLYGGDTYYRLCQEAVLGLGGVAMLEALGYDRIRCYHMNEGHSSLLAIAVLRKLTQGKGLQHADEQDIEAVRQQCIFTTHTPVPAGHDNFPSDMVEHVLGNEHTHAMRKMGSLVDHRLNMTYLALFFSRYVNGVSHRHEEISQNMFPKYPIDSVTNGVHSVEWASPPFQELYDHHIPEWRRDNMYLRYASSIPLDEIRYAHAESKLRLLKEVEARTGKRLDSSVMTLGFARRATMYKRADLLFSDIERLKKISRDAGPIQIIYSGKAHPADEGSKQIIRKVFEAARTLGDRVPVVYLEEYDMSLARYICTGVDLWLNTPQKPFEASGTSGMKAALNGIPSLSVLDGWWIEGHAEGVTGWSIGEGLARESNTSKELSSLYDKLENTIVPMFYTRSDDYARVMRSAISLNSSFFNAQRMMLQYLQNAYIVAGR